MSEISVNVKQEPGKITWNYEEIKKHLECELARYSGLIYDDESIKTAKSDVAELRALAKQIEDRRKEVKSKCLEPYEKLIEPQAKELVALIDKPIQAINTQVQDYEKRRKEKAKAEIDAYWKQKVTELPECIWEKAHERIYDSRWENATATKKSWKEGIDTGIQQIIGDIDTIKSFASKFEEDMLKVFYATLSLQDAIRKMNDLNAQEQRVLELQRQEKERAEREAAEREAKEKALAERTAEQPVIPEPTQTQESEISENKANPVVVEENIPQTVNKPEMVQEKPGIVLRITGNEQQIAKIKDYIKFTGASFEEVM